MIKRILYTFLFIIIALQSYSQAWSRYKYEAYYGIGATNFMGDICAPTPEASPISQAVWIKFWNTVGITGNAGLRYNISERQYIRGSLFLGRLIAEDPVDNPKYWDRGISVSSFYTELSAKYEYVIWKEKKKATVYKKLGESTLKNFSLPTYLFIGLGGNFNIGKFAKVSSDGKYVIDESFNSFSPIIPIGIGFKYKINRLTYFNLEATWNFALGDNLDNANGKTNSAYGVWIDQYQSITFNIVHRLRQNQNGSPKLFSKKNNSY